MTTSASPVELPQLPPELSDERVDAIFAANHNVREEPWTNWRRFARAIGQQCLEAERERCAQACEGEVVDAENSGAESDYAYNAAIEHCAAAIRKG